MDIACSLGSFVAKTRVPLFHGVRVASRLDGSTREWSGPQAEGEADVWLRRHVRMGLAWEWVVELDVEVEGHGVVRAVHRVEHGAAVTVRRAVAGYLLRVAADPRRCVEEREGARRLAHALEARGSRGLRRVWTPRGVVVVDEVGLPVEGSPVVRFQGRVGRSQRGGIA